jgi:hypothetical protein
MILAVIVSDSTGAQNVYRGVGDILQLISPYKIG